MPLPRSSRPDAWEPATHLKHRTQRLLTGTTACANGQQIAEPTIVKATRHPDTDKRQHRHPSISCQGEFHSGKMQATHDFATGSQDCPRRHCPFQFLSRTVIIVTTAPPMAWDPIGVSMVRGSGTEPIPFAGPGDGPDATKKKKPKQPRLRCKCKGQTAGLRVGTPGP